MTKLTNFCLAQVKQIFVKVNISNPSCNDRAFSAVRRILNQTYAVAKAISVKWMFRILVSRGLVLTPVTKMCEKLYDGSKKAVRRKEICRKVMSVKAIDADVKCKKERKKLTKVWGYNINILKTYNLKRPIEMLAKEEMKYMTDVFIKQKQKKIDFLKRKHDQHIVSDKQNRRQSSDSHNTPNADKQSSDNVDNIEKVFECVVTGDRQLPPAFSSEPRVYGGVSVTDEEKKALNLPPKFTIYEKIDKEKCFVEIETMVSKYMWEMRKRNKEEEEEESECRTRRTKGRQSRESRRQIRIPETIIEDEEEIEGREETHPKYEREPRLNTPHPLSPTITPRPRSPESATTSETETETEADTQHRNNHHKQTVGNGTAENDEKAEYETRDYHYNVDTKTFDFRNLRPTDLPFNKQLFLPQSDRNREESEEEIQIAYLSHQLQKATNEFIAEHKFQQNLTKQEKEGIRSIQKREDVVVYQTDKSSRFSIDSKNNYVEACGKHTRNDEVIDEKEYDRIISDMNAHAIMWAKILKAGEFSGENGPQRIKENMMSAEKLDPPPLYALRKDHKPFENEVTGPPTRPVCGATAAHNGKLSHLLSMMLKEVKKLDEDSSESTEDILAEIQEVNERTGATMQDEEKLIVGSLDVKALYPSIDVDFAADVVANEVYKSAVEVDESSINVEELGLYLMLTTDEKELQDSGMRKHCPTRKSKKGRKPNITGQANCSNERRQNIWTPPINPRPNKKMMKQMLCKALATGIKKVMDGHVYKFDDKVLRQKSGGAIGLEMTGELAGVFMMWWDRKMRERLSDEGVNLQMYKRYVDDINIVVQAKKTDDEHEIMEKIKMIGNKIHKSIQLESDHPTRNEDGKVPILDLKVWINEENKVVHEYYMKPVASKAVVNHRSAMPLKDRRTVISQEILRIVLRCSPLLPWERVKMHIEDYMMRLQFSGYDEKFRKQALRSAAKAYNKIKDKVRKGERPLYRRKNWKQSERMKEKRRRKEEWYKAKGDKKKKQEEYMSVIFVQPTEKSALKKKYEDVIRKSECNVKVVERAGVSVRRKLQKSYPFKKNVCEDKCFVCMSQGKGNCRRSNVTYLIECTRQGCRYQYVGETSRNGISRGKEHLKGLEKRDQDSVLAQHIREFHESDFSAPPCHQFKMCIKQSHETAMNRLVTEAVKIDTSTKPLMNRKRGYRVNSVLSLSSLSDVSHC